MLSLSPATRVFVALEPVDMRNDRVSFVELLNVVGPEHEERGEVRNAGNPHACGVLEMCVLDLSDEATIRIRLRFLYNAHPDRGARRQPVEHIAREQTEQVLPSSALEVDFEVGLRAPGVADVKQNPMGCRPFAPGHSRYTYSATV